MEQISNEKFGLFVMELRKEMKLTQKELAEKLYVSDKTVSKWERGMSMPNIVLLIPIADVLDVTVTELLRGERLPIQQSSGEIQEPKTESFDSSIRNTLRQYKKKWIIVYFLCLFISMAEFAILILSEISFIELKESVLLITLLMYLFGGWFCFFAKELLPTYYDGNKINYVTQGVFRIHMVGLTFNNGNWPYICTTLKIWTLGIAAVYPLACILVINLVDLLLWNEIKNILAGGMMLAMMISVYAIGKKYQ